MHRQQQHEVTTGARRPGRREHGHRAADDMPAGGHRAERQAGPRVEMPAGGHRAERAERPAGHRTERAETHATHHATTERAGDARRTRTTTAAAEMPARQTDRKKSLESLLDAAGDARRGRQQPQLQPQHHHHQVRPVPVPGEKVISFPGQGLEFKELSYSVIKKQKLKDGVKVNKEVYLLNDISGQALRGQVTAILGPSGAGKSTFLDALAGRIAKGSLEGSVSIDGRSV